MPQVQARIRILEESLAARGTDATTATDAEAASDSDDEETSEASSGTGMLIGAGAAGAVAIVGAVYWANRGSELSACHEGSTVDRLCSNETTLERQRNTGLAITLLGAVAAPSLLAIGLVQRRQSRHEDRRVSVACVPGFLGAACAGTF